MFVWRVDVFLRALAQYLPEIYVGLERLRPHLDQPTWDVTLREVYAGFPIISVDYGVMEKARNVLVIPADIGWSDVGDWASLGSLFPLDENGNNVQGRHIGVESRGCVIFTERPGRLVATLGLEDLVIVDTEEALLVLPKARAQEI